MPSGYRKNVLTGTPDYQSDLPEGDVSKVKRRIYKVYVDKEDHEMLKKIAKDKKMSLADLVTEIVFSDREGSP